MRFAVALATLLTVALPGAPVLAQDEAPPPPEPRFEQRIEPQREPRFQERRSELPESVLRAERQTGGTVLRAESMQRDGREVYRLKVLTPDGRVRIMRDDPRERRREAWRDSRREDVMRDPFEDAPSRRDDGERFRERDDSRFRDAAPSRFDDAPRFDERPAPPPSDLDMPETLPPERGDRH